MASRGGGCSRRHGGSGKVPLWNWDMRHWVHVGASDTEHESPLLLATWPATALSSYSTYHCLQQSLHCVRRHKLALGFVLRCIP